MRTVVFGLYYPVNETFDEAAVHPGPPAPVRAEASPAATGTPVGAPVGALAALSASPANAAPQDRPSPQRIPLGRPAGLGGTFVAAQVAPPPSRITASLYAAIAAAARPDPQPAARSAPPTRAPLQPYTPSAQPRVRTSAGPMPWLSPPAPARAPRRRAPDGRQDGMPHLVLGLFAPKVIQLRARLGEQDWTRLDLPRAGLYRPAGLRLAPWTGLPYTPAPLDGIGLSAQARVLTMRGEVRVDELQPQDRLVGLRGPRVARITAIAQVPGWSLGRDAPRVLIPAHALGPNEPTADLVVGPNQVLFPDGTDPVRAQDLVRDGRARPISQEAASQEAASQGDDLFQVVLSPYPGAEDGDVLLVNGIFTASSTAPAPQAAAQPGVETAVVGAYPILRG